MLERLITRTEITGHQMYNGFATRPNLLTWVVTINGAFFSTDMAQRAVVIRLQRPPETTHNWDAETAKFIHNNRDAIVADVRWHLEVKEAATLKKVNRWGPWCLGVLSRCQQPDSLLTDLAKRGNEIDADKQDIELALDHLGGCIASYYDSNPDEKSPSLATANLVVWAPTAWFVQALRLLKRDCNDRQAQQFLARMTSSPRFVVSRTNVRRGYLWIGQGVDMKSPPPELIIPYTPEIASLRGWKSGK
jgi:hypothetical protein